MNGSRKAAQPGLRRMSSKVFDGAKKVLMIRAGSDKRGAVSAGIGGMAVLIAFLDEDVGNSVSDCSRSDEHLPAKSDGNAATLQAAAPGAGQICRKYARARR